MTRQNLDAVRAIYAEWERGNFRAGGELLDPHVMWIVAHGSPEPGVYVGSEEVTTWMRVQLDAWERLTVAAEEFLEAGDSIVVAVRRRGIGKGARVPVQDRHFHVWSFRGRTVTRMEFFRERSEALAAVGRSE